MSRDLDCLLVVPLERIEQLALLDATGRQSVGANLALPLFRATAAFESYLGLSPAERLWRNGVPMFDDEALIRPRMRSMSGVVLASALEQAGLTWQALDPGEQKLEYWRKELPKFRRFRPRTVGLCTTFVLTVPWLKTYVSLIRANFPDAKILVGGYYYASNTKEFLSLDADVMCVGEGEVRLPQMVRAVKEGKSLENIPGLYIRKPDKTLHYTGKAEPLRLDEIEPPDWTVAERMHPPVSLATDGIQYGVETQRGCVFKCQYCTYRTLALPNFGDLERVVDGIFRIPHLDRGTLTIIDATATYPKERFEAFMQLVANRGGFPCPTDLCARVNDVTDKNAKLMRAAGVTSVSIGQESGDQGMLQLMKKGTHVSRVRPALAALGRNDIIARISFIHGFPGETMESVQKTRQLICSLNDGFEGRPVAMVYAVYPFMNLDLAEAKNSDGDLKHLGYYEYNTGFSSRRAAEECLATFIAVGKVPHGPADGTVCAITNLPIESLSCHRRGRDVHRWVKAVARGIGIFLERDLEGTQMNDAELRRVREQVIAPIGSRTSLRERVGTRVSSGLKRAFMQRLRSEFLAEPERGAGVLTRLTMGGMNLSDQGDARSAWRTMRDGQYVVPSLNGEAAGAITSSSEVERFASQLIEDSVSAPSAWIKSESFQGQLRQGRQLRVLAD